MPDFPYKTPTGSVYEATDVPGSLEKAVRLADFFDAFLLGDGEEAVIEIAEACRAWKRSGTPKADLLEKLAAIEAAVLAFGGTAGSELYWWPETLAAPTGTSGNFEVETVTPITGGMTTIGFKSSSLSAGLLATGQWIVIEGVLYRVITTTTSSGKTATATIFPAYRGRIGGLIDWGMTNYAKAPRWLVTASPELTKDEAGNLLPWTLQLRQIPYATYPF